MDLYVLQYQNLGVCTINSCIIVRHFALDHVNVDMGVLEIIVLFV
jgi:hypothetical protein